VTALHAILDASSVVSDWANYACLIISAVEGIVWFSDRIRDARFE